MLRTPHSPKAMQKMLQIPGTPVYDPPPAQHQTKGHMYHSRIIIESRKTIKHKHKHKHKHVIKVTPNIIRPTY